MKISSQKYFLAFFVMFSSFGCGGGGGGDGDS